MSWRRTTRVCALISASSRPSLRLSSTPTKQASSGRRMGSPRVPLPRDLLAGAFMTGDYGRKCRRSSEGGTRPFACISASRVYLRDNFERNECGSGDDMRTTSGIKVIAALAFAVLAGAIGCAHQSATIGLPQYKVDAAWPKPLKDNWIWGQVSSVTVDSHDHVWVLHRPSTMLDDDKGAQQKPPTNRCCVAAPAVVEFDEDGNYVQGWGGPGQGYDWPKNEHGIHVDWQGNVWISGNDPADNHVLKFTRDGKFILQIGKPGKSEGSNS